MLHVIDSLLIVLTQSMWDTSVTGSSCFIVYLYVSFSFFFVLLAANKEAGYVRALSLAAIAHTVAKACKEHGENLHSCSCEDDLDIQVSQEPGDIVMPGCSDNMEFGLRFAETFLNKSFHGIGNKEKLDFHNIRAGRLVST